jgi:hypothetical protein
MMAIFRAIVPRFALFVGWYNDAAFWNAVFGSQFFFVLGFLFLPWTTLIYGLASPNGLSIVNWIFLLFGVLIDLGTWGIGFFAARQQTSSYRGT